MCNSQMYLTCPAPAPLLLFSSSEIPQSRIERLVLASNVELRICLREPPQRKREKALYTVRAKAFVRI